MTVRRVLVLWADNHSANLGVRALAEGTALLARMAWGKECVVDFQDFKGRESDTAFNKQAIVRDLLSRHGPVTSKLASYDVVIDTGAGDSFTDIYGMKRFAAIHYAQRCAIGGPGLFVMGPQTVGPFERRVSKRLAARTLQRADKVMSRDGVSSEYAEMLGCSKTWTATDVVFALPRREARGERDQILLNISGLLWHGNRHVKAERYRDMVLTLTRELVYRGERVKILPHVLDNPSKDNDVVASEWLAREVPEVDGIVKPLGLAGARDAIARSKLVIGARMHACLNALSQGVPAIPMAYSRKFAPLLSELGWDYGIDLRAQHDGMLDSLYRQIGELKLIGAAGAERVRDIGVRRIAEAAQVLADMGEARA